MKIVAIGDIHGKSTWKYIIQNEPDFDVLIFIGDYWDSFDISFEHQMHNFNEIIEFKEALEIAEPNKKVIMLIGNHDWHYLPYIDDTRMSGYQLRYAFKIKQLMEKNHHHFTMAYEQDGYLFSHAGISEKFLYATYPDWTIDTLVQDVNDLFKYKPIAFQLIGPDPYGKNPHDTPIWIRPKSLMNANADSSISKKYIQVFGHTASSFIKKFHRRDFIGYSIDVLGYNNIEYLKIENGELSIVNSKFTKQKKNG